MGSWRNEYDAMYSRMKAFGESDADASADAAYWANLLDSTSDNDTTRDDEEDCYA